MGRGASERADFHARTGDWATDLLLAVLLQAIKDGKRNRTDAIIFLDCFLDGALDGGLRKVPTKRQCKRR